MNAAKRVLRYHKGSRDLCIIYGGSGKESAPRLFGYSDSDWGSDNMTHRTRRSVTGYVFYLANGPVSWSSKLQPTVALSTAEAEYMAASAAVQEAVFLRELLKSMGLPQTEATVIKENNQAAIALSNNPVTSKRIKHIDIRCHFVREKTKSGQIVLNTSRRRSR